MYLNEGCKEKYYVKGVIPPILQDMFWSFFLCYHFLKRLRQTLKLSTNVEHAKENVVHEM